MPLEKSKISPVLFDFSQSGLEHDSPAEMEQYLFATLVQNTSWPNENDILHFTELQEISAFSGFHDWSHPHLAIRLKPDQIAVSVDIHTGFSVRAELDKLRREYFFGTRANECVIHSDHQIIVIFQKPEMESVMPDDYLVIRSNMRIHTGTMFLPAPGHLTTFLHPIFTDAGKFCWYRGVKTLTTLNKVPPLLWKEIIEIPDLPELIGEEFFQTATFRNLPDDFKSEMQFEAQMLASKGETLGIKFKIHESAGGTRKMALFRMLS